MDWSNNLININGHLTIVLSVKNQQNYLGMKYLIGLEVRKFLLKRNMN